MKKFLCLILSFLLIITSVTVPPAKVKAKSENYTDGYVFGEKDFFSASDTANDKDMTFTATEDGLYSVRIKTIEGFNNLSIAKDPDGNEIEPYARDYRIGDRTRIDYYQLKKGQVFTIKFMLHANSSALIIADIVREINKDDEFNFTGEYDVSYYYNPSEDYHYYKLGCLMDTDDNGNNVLNARVRYFQNENNDELDYLIQVATDKNFKKNKKSILVKKQKTTSAKIKKLKSKKKYYVRVRTYKVVGRKKVYSSWINGKATKTK